MIDELKKLIKYFESKMLLKIDKLLYLQYVLLSSLRIAKNYFNVIFSNFLIFLLKYSLFIAYWTSLWLSVFIIGLEKVHCAIIFTLFPDIYKNIRRIFNHWLCFLSLYSSHILLVFCIWNLWRICTTETKLQSHIEWYDIIISLLQHTSNLLCKMHASLNSGFRNFGQKFLFRAHMNLYYSTMVTRMYAYVCNQSHISSGIFLSLMYDVWELHSWINFPRKLCNEYTMRMHEYVQIDVRMNIYANIFRFVILAVEFCVTIWFSIYRKIWAIF